MRILSVLVGALSVAGLISAAPGGGPGGPRNPPSSQELEDLALKEVNVLQKQYQKKIIDHIKPRKTGCTQKNILRRKEWHALSIPERLSYIAAVHCLHRKPAVTNRTLIPGVRSRYDDLVGIHLFQTDFVHSSGLFLPFHRYYVHLYEKALREECGYRGAQPYWDWTLWYDDPRRAPLFNGSPWSMGSNGKYIPDRNDTLIDIVPGFPPFLVAPATGGGCIERGPFTEQLWKAHIGPVGIRPQGPQGGLEYNPRCLKRDLSPIWSQDTRPTNASKLLNCPDLACVNEVFDAPQGIHGSGHFQIGGEELDVYVSPNDPIFWLHHAQVDRLWSIWQGLDIQNRTNQVWGTVTTFNVPPSDPATLDSPVPFGPLLPSKPIRDLVSTVDGDMCYMYE